MLHSELVAVATQPCAFGGGNEETGADPFTVVVVTVHCCHAPEVHVADFKGLGPGHRKGAVGGTEIAVNTGVNAQFTQTEVFVGGQFEQDVIAGGRGRPIQRWLRVAGEVVAGLIPNGQALSRCG